MITDLTIENLIKLGLNKQRATELFNESNGHNFQGNEGNFYLLDNKVYTDIDYYRMTCFNRGSINFPLNCPDLIDEYFNLSLNKYLLEHKEVLKSIFVAEDQKKKFISNEILNAKNRIEHQKVMLKRLPHFGSERKENAISILEAYINFCETKLKQPQQPEAKKTDEVVQEFNFINNFDTVKEATVYNYFKEKITDKKYLTKEILEQFLKIAFEKKEKPKQRFVFENMNTKAKIIQIFYGYYKLAGKPQGKQPKYAELLGEYFIEFNTINVKSNFSK